MKDTRPTSCIECGSEKYNRIYSDVHVAIDTKRPKTVGELAIKNTETKIKRGEMPKQALEYDERKKKKQQFNDKLAKMSKMNKKQTQKYIRTGELPK